MNNPSNPHLLEQTSDDDLIAELSRRFPPTQRQFYPVVWFNFLNQYRPAPTAECLCFRVHQGRTEILLVDRQPTDIGYEGQCHTPGGYLLMGESIPQLLKRLVRDELATDMAAYRPAGAYNDTNEVRGHHVHMLFVIELAGEPSGGHWEPIDHLPANLIPQFSEIIKIGHGAFILATQ